MKKFSVAEDMERVKNLYRFEDAARAEGYNLIAGVDEAGRGSLVAPPICILNALTTPKNFPPKFVTFSTKKLPLRQ